MGIKLMLVSWFKCAEDSINCKFFTVNTTDFAFVYEKKYYLQVYLDNCANNNVNAQMIKFLDEDLFESDKNQLFEGIDVAKSNNSKECIV